jgi:hypothetical protein
LFLRTSQATNGLGNPPTPAEILTIPKAFKGPVSARCIIVAGLKASQKPLISFNKIQ